MIRPAAFEIISFELVEGPKTGVLDIEPARLVVEQTMHEARPGEYVAGLMDWHITVQVAAHDMELDDYVLRMGTADGREFTGRALMSQTDLTVHHFTGNGALSGFDPDADF